jgi:DNA repair exonuclease SbcCD nuclease subunit
MRTVELLAIGDVHLGTRPGGIPVDLAQFGIEARLLTPEAALDLAVDRAIAERVAAVVFAGDVVESTNARFEAIRPLEQAVRRLAGAGIPVLAVVGNHDVEALPRLARLIEGLTLLGEGGRWGSQLIEVEGRPAVEILGWSFPERQVHTSPLADLLRHPLPAKHTGVPRIGVLHGDLDASGGSYAPFRRRELDEAGLDAWLLGHVHKPSLASEAGGGGPRGYLGSLVGLDPTETGARGPWLVRIDDAGRVAAEHLPLAPLRWERLELVLAEDEGADDLGDRILGEAERLASELQRSGATPRALGLRVRLVGRSRRYDEIRQRVRQGLAGEIRRMVGDTLVFVEQVSEALVLAVDLEALARGDDPAALLARKLVALQRGGEPARAILDRARAELRAMAEDGRWVPLADLRGAVDPLGDAALAACLARAGTEALHALLAQRMERSGSAPP